MSPVQHLIHFDLTNLQGSDKSRLATLEHLVPNVEELNFLLNEKKKTCIFHTFENLLIFLNDSVNSGVTQFRQTPI
jgi:hypothetical protein